MNYYYLKPTDIIQAEDEFNDLCDDLGWWKYKSSVGQTVQEGAHPCETPNWFCMKCGHRFYSGHCGGIICCPVCDDDRINRL